MQKLFIFTMPVVYELTNETMLSCECNANILRKTVTQLTHQRVASSLPVATSTKILKRRAIKHLQRGFPTDFMKFC